MRIAGDDAYLFEMVYRICLSMEMPMKTNRPVPIILSLILLIPIIPAYLSAQVPELINYQGRLVDGTNLVNGNVSMVMRLYDDSTAGTLLYADSNTVSVVDGIYNTHLGDDTVTGSLTDALNNSQVYVELDIDGTILLPRERLVAVPYALRAGYVEKSALSTKVQAGREQVPVWAGIGGRYTTTTNFPITFSPAFTSDPVVYGSASHISSVGFTLTAIVSGYLGTKIASSVCRPSLTTINGMPAISYDNGAQQLIYISATDADGSSWSDPVVVDEAVKYGFVSSLAEVNGKPAIAYLKDDVGRPMVVEYVRALDSDGTSWGTPLLVTNLHASIDDYDSSVSLAMVNGNPAIAFHEDNSQLHYTRSLDSTGGMWNGIQKLVPGGFDGSSCLHLLSVNTNPAVAYIFDKNYPNALGDLHYIRAIDQNGTSWNTPLVIATNTFGGDSRDRLMSASVVSGTPSITYYDNNTSRLKFIHANDANGSIWSTAITVDTNRAAGSKYSSLLTSNGKPAIGYSSAENDTFLFVTAVTTNGSSWHAPIIAGHPTSFSYDSVSSLCVSAGGYPMAIHGNYYTQAHDINGASWGTNGTVPAIWIAVEP